jgi:hypothetical protein
MQDVSFTQQNPLFHAHFSNIFSLFLLTHTKSKTTAVAAVVKAIAISEP